MFRNKAWHARNRASETGQQTFGSQQKPVARKLNNLRLSKIGFKTLRQFKGITVCVRGSNMLQTQEVLDSLEDENTRVKTAKKMMDTFKSSH